MEVEIVDIIAVGHVNKHFDGGKLTTYRQNGGLPSSKRKVRGQPQHSMLKTSQLLHFDGHGVRGVHHEQVHIMC